MRKSNEIKPELDETAARLNELLAMRQDIETNLKTLQKGFIKRDKTLDELQAEQSKLTILNDSIESLESARAELQTAFDEATAAEARSEQIEKAKAAALGVESVYSDYLTHRFETNEYLHTLGNKLFDAGFSFLDKQNKLQSALTAITPNISISELELPKETADLVSGKARALPPLEFADIIAEVENRTGTQRQGEAQTKREIEKAAGH